MMIVGARRLPPGLAVRHASLGAAAVFMAPTSRSTCTPAPLEARTIISPPAPTVAALSLSLKKMPLVARAKDAIAAIIQAVRIWFRSLRHAIVLGPVAVTCPVLLLCSDSSQVADFWWEWAIRSIEASGPTVLKVRRRPVRRMSA